MTTENPSEDRKRSAVMELVLEIQRRDDPSRNRELIGLLRDDLISCLRSATVFGPNRRFNFLQQVLDSFTERHLELPTDETGRSLSFLYRFRPEQDGDFVTYLSEKLRNQNNIYEPHATYLAGQIRAGVDEAENKSRLVALLYPFLSLTAYQAMHGYHYTLEDIEESVACQVERMLCHGREGWTGKNNRHYDSWIYRFDPEKCSEFCTYLGGKLHAQYLTWCRNMDGVQAIREEIHQDREAMAEKPEKKEFRTYYRSVETSMDAGDTDREGKDYESSRSAIQAALAAEEALARQEERRLEEQARDKAVDAAAQLFLAFFDKVDALDEDRPGPRSVTERGILSYHLKFATGVWSRLRTDGFGDEEEFYSRQIRNHAHSFRGIASMMWDKPMLQVVSFQSRDYQMLFRREHAYLGHLAQRLFSGGLEGKPYLEAESDIQNRAPGWAATVERRVKRDYDSMIVDRFRKIREEIYNEIQ